MGGLKPIGSEKLHGNEKLQRIMEIANYKFATSVKSDDNTSTEYRLKLADGNSYEIVREKQGYIIKKNITENVSDYIEPMKNRRYFNSYSQALKKINLMSKEMNELYGNSNGLELFGEAKSFKLKVPKPKADLETPPAAPTLPPPSQTTPAPAPSEPIPSPAPSADASSTPTPSPTGNLPMGDSMGAENTGGSSPSEEPMDDVPMDDEGNDDIEEPTDDEETDGKDPFRMIQKLVGKLTQKIRKFPKDEEMTAENVKYIINSILSALDLTLLDEDDVEEIMTKFENEEEGDEEDLPDQEGNIEDEGPVEDEDMKEPEGEMTEYSYRNRFRKRIGGGLDNTENEMFGESLVDTIISSYFNPENEKIMNEEKRFERKKIIRENYKVNKLEVERLSESTSQMRKALEFIKSYPQAEVLGTTNKKNMVIKLGNDQYKITPNGKFL